jgi:Spy/CpxP family protein refolding chaperone
MKSIRSRFLVAALAVMMGSVFAKSQTADAPPPPPMHGHEFGMGGHMMEFMAKKLNLTDEQKTQMKAVFEKERPTIKPLMLQEHQIDLQLRQYVEGAFDQAKVQALAAQKAQIQAQLTVQETRIHNELYQLLTPDQQSQVKQMEAHHEARMQQHLNSNNDEPTAPPAQD